MPTDPADNLRPLPGDGESRARTGGDRIRAVRCGKMGLMNQLQIMQKCVQYSGQSSNG
jgi:hypothetical protein